MARHLALVSTRAPVMARVEDEDTGGFAFTAVVICKYLFTGLTLADDTCEPLVELKPTISEGEPAEMGADELAGETLVEVQPGDTGKSLVGLELTPLEGETAESGADRLAGEAVIEVLAGGKLVGLEPTPLEGETAESGEDRLAGEKVIEVLAGSSGEPLVGLESTPEGETACDSDSKTD